ncbi:MAG: helix-hairpin-helix domain-containing protein [Candidatus Acidiferrales bacterium]|jgi:competence ComEA-like helix-hairpin-helix protein
MPVLMQRAVRYLSDITAIRCAGVVALLVATVVLSAEAKKHPPEHPLDLNTATLEQLEELPNVGPGVAAAIVEFRAKSGPFKRVEDLLAIRGITKQRLEKIRPYVVVNSPAKPTNDGLGIARIPRGVATSYKI